MAIAAARHAFGRVQSDQVAALQQIEDAPDLSIGLSLDVGRRCLALGAPVEIEAQPVIIDPSGDALLLASCDGAHERRYRAYWHRKRSTRRRRRGVLEERCRSRDTKVEIAASSLRASESRASWQFGEHVS